MTPSFISSSVFHLIFSHLRRSFSNLSYLDLCLILLNYFSQMTQGESFELMDKTKLTPILQLH